MTFILAPVNIMIFSWIYFGNTQSVYTFFRNQSQIFPGALNFTHSLYLDFEVGYRRYRPALRRLFASRYHLSITLFKLLI
jgi:hypothetical protein